MDKGQQQDHSQTKERIQKTTQNQVQEEITEFGFKEADLTSLQPQLTHQYLKTMFKDPKVDYAMGAMFGAFIGDSLGSYCQFKNHIHQTLLEETMEMRGGGTFFIRAGQFTDDSQMATHMLTGLSKYDPTKTLKDQEYLLLKNIATQYLIWEKSDPFDIGMTTRSAISKIGKQLYDQKVQQKTWDQQEFITTLLPKIYTKNQNSQANGSLMRITPMCLFSAYINDNQQDKATSQSFIKKQIQLTHPNHTLVTAGYAWVDLISKIINRNRTNSTLAGIYQQFIQQNQNKQLLKDWIKVAKQQDLIPGVPNMGWAKIAFSYGINKMRLISNQNQQSLNQNVYIHSIKDVIGKAGDTDTNGAIVGGLIGSILGFKRLPKKYIKKLFQLRLNQSMKNCSYRSQFYEPRRAFIKGIQLIQKFRKSNQHKPK